MSESTDTTSTTFVSPTNNLTLVREPARRKMVGDRGDYVNLPGHRVEFVDGELVSDDPGLIEWLRGHDQYGALFHERGNEPDLPGGDVTADVELVIDLAFDNKYEEIADLLVRERSTLSRPAVIAACEKALNRGGGEIPPKPETPAHERVYQRDLDAGGAIVTDPHQGSSEVVTGQRSTENAG